MKIALITGASSGIGFETAKEMAEAGYKVYGAARRIEKLELLKPFNVQPIQMDITDTMSVKAAVELIIKEEKRIDVLVNNAGYGSYGAIEDVSIEDAKQQFEVNLFGLAELTKQVLPHMRAQQSGKIINISSMGGRVTTYMGGWYHATKYALEAFSDALRMEVAEFGIDVVIIEPGGIKTDWGLISADHLEKTSKGGAYEVSAKKAADILRKQYHSNMLSKPTVISKAIVKAAGSSRPKTRYLIGFGAKPLVFLHAVLPDRAFDRIIKGVSK